MSRLAAKLRENWERREHEALLKVLPNKVLRSLEKAECIYSKQYFETVPVSPYPSFLEGKITASLNFSIYLYFDYDDLNHVLNVLNTCSLTLEPPVYCWFGRGLVFKIADRIDIDFICEIARTNDLLSNGQIYLAEEGLNKGIIIDSYSGYIERDRVTNHNEIVYELVYFSSPIKRRELIDNSRLG